MYRTATGFLLIYGALLMAAHDVHAASGNPRTADDRSTVSRNTNGNVGGKKTKTQRLPEKNLALASQAGGGLHLQDVAMRSPIRDMETRQPTAPSVDEVAGSGSWFAMLIAGLGVALISIFRRIGGLS